MMLLTRWVLRHHPVTPAVDPYYIAVAIRRTELFRHVMLLFDILCFLVNL